MTPTTAPLEPPPGMPDDDDGSPDGGGPPRRAALANARFAAQNWANVTGVQKYVVENGPYVFVALMPIWRIGINATSTRGGQSSGTCSL